MSTNIENSLKEDAIITEDFVKANKESLDPILRKKALLAETLLKHLEKDTLTFDELEQYQKELEQTQGYYQEDGKLFYQDDFGERFEIDFDINKYLQEKEKNNQQVYKRTFSVPPANKINDESKMTKENESQEDIKEDAKEKEEPKKTEEKPKKTEVCEKELDMLREKAKKFDTLDKVAKDFTVIEEKVKNLTTLQEKIEKDLKEKETKISAEKEQLRKDKAKKITQDFQLPEKLIESESQDFLDKIDNILNLAIKKPKNINEIQVDFETPQSDFQKQATALREKYKIKVVK